ncbi:hypothetical protein HBI56_161480 [Parastagonospora nodorum]|nr:hypothetical protein HBI10_186230 [Parastagonospora nodorum]KAH4014331.1 hypothetical protein HBI13_172780 [Parastagonospora nodorum]KAH4022498.1 hypothetical protein HBI09_170250 [Parastagonospora nodorum]KAH4081301.1 hypothetical protein HBH46_226970 [Parastagonospora nodorum]KAH4113586.1 hypothetical protein HBH47_208630 [Parastagonospora nodorum]
MRLEIIAIVFATVVAAKPWPWAAPAANLVPTANAQPNKTHRGNRTKHHHHEHTPTFKEPCNCPQPIVPMNLLSENEKCLMKHAAAIGCYIGSKGGCPSPAPACGLGVTKAIPYTH